MDKREKELFVDLESGVTSSGEESCNDHVSANATFDRVWSGVFVFDGLGRGERESETNSYSSSSGFGRGESKHVELLIEKSSGEYSELATLVENNIAEEKLKKTNVRKPTKPPRPPKGPTLDLADQKLVREITELAMRKRARTKRMQAFKKMKASKSSSTRNSVYALIITVLFCLVLIFQGICSKGSGSMMTDGSPAPAIASSTEALVSVQMFKNFSNQ